MCCIDAVKTLMGQWSECAVFRQQSDAALMLLSLWQLSDIKSALNHCETARDTLHSCDWQTRDQRRGEICITICRRLRYQDRTPLWYRDQHFREPKSHLNRWTLLRHDHHLFHLISVNHMYSEYRYFIAYIFFSLCVRANSVCSLHFHIHDVQSLLSITHWQHFSSPSIIGESITCQTS